MQIKDVKMSDAKTLMISLHNSGRSFNTIDRVKSVLKPAFKVAVDDDIIRKNPFDFSLTEVVKKDEKHRVALTPEQQNQWMTFVRNDRTYSRYYDEFLVLLETGMRVSELCGLTISDLDFKNRKIYINRQLQKEDDGTYYIGETKSESGKRIVPMNDNVYVSLQNIVKNRKAPEVETMVDGCCGFILLTRTGKPKTSENIQETIRWARRKYKKVHPESPLPDITPHVFRHTFCTNMANSGMSVKSLQYLMGHSESSTTLDVYAHPDYDIAEKEMTKIMSFESAKNNKKKQIS
jgi:integrase